jgi:hypothetical protein
MGFISSDWRIIFHCSLEKSYVNGLSWSKIRLSLGFHEHGGKLLVFMKENGIIFHMNSYKISVQSMQATI